MFVCINKTNEHFLLTNLINIALSVGNKMITGPTELLTNFGIRRRASFYKKLQNYWTAENERDVLKKHKLHSNQLHRISLHYTFIR